MPLAQDVCRLYYARSSNQVDPVGRPERVHRDWIRWLAGDEETLALTLADRAEGIDSGRARTAMTAGRTRPATGSTSTEMRTCWRNWFDYYMRQFAEIAPALPHKVVKS